MADDDGEGVHMRESSEFLATLEHNNELRPRFRIRPDRSNTLLAIEYLGQSIEVPISEVLSFAARWRADQERSIAQDQVPRLQVHPYPIYNIGVDDPDRCEWWVPFE